jgi:hypothetical protein
MIAYSPRAAKALGFLKKFFNDIEIYVEDRTCHHMYVLLFRKILPGSTRLTSINQIGNRNAVIEACRRDQTEDGRKKIYLIDGDFDYYHNRRKPKLKHLYRLRAYCIENILIHEDAAVAVAAHADTNAAETVIAARLEFRKWMADITQKLRSLFVIYATSEALGAGIPTTSFPVQRLFDGGGLSTRKITRRMLAVARAVCKKKGLETYKKQRRIIQRNIAAIRMTMEQMISGKSYLLPLLHDRMHRLFGYRGSADQLRTQLAENYIPDLEPWLRKRVLHIIGAI